MLGLPELSVTPPASQIFVNGQKKSRARHACSAAARREQPPDQQPRRRFEAGDDAGLSFVLEPVALALDLDDLGVVESPRHSTEVCASGGRSRWFR